MEKVMLGITIGGVPSHVITVVHSLVDFIYLLQLQSHTSSMLILLESCLKMFHCHKNIIVKLRIRKHFNIPKLHSLLHYVDCIHSLGSADGYNTESPERLHIDFEKEAYCASNKRDYLEQMAIWLQRHEAMWLRDSYLIWVDKRLPSMIRTEINRDTMDEEDEDVIDQINLNLNVTQRDKINMNLDVTQRDINIMYSLAKQPPYANLTVEKITQKFGTTKFLPALTTFL